MRTLHLTNQQFDVLYHILEDTVLDIEEDVVSDTVTYQIYKQLIHLRGDKSWLKNYSFLLILMQLIVS